MRVTPKPATCEDDGVTDEATIEIPDAWRRAVHPRRGGILGIPPADIITRGAAADYIDYAVRQSASRVDLEVERRAVLQHPGTDRELAKVADSKDAGVSADGVRLALAPSPLREVFWRSHSLVPIRELVATRGLTHAAAAFVHSCAYYVGRVQGFGHGGSPLIRHREADDVGADSWPRGVWDDAALFLRSALAIAPDAEYTQTREALAPLRRGLFRQRIVTSYLMPDVPDWTDADFAELPSGYRGPVDLLFFSANTVEQLSRFTAVRLDQFLTAYDAVGEAAIPLLALWLRRGRWNADVRQDALEVLARIPSDIAFEVLLRNLDVEGAARTVRVAADRFPMRAGRMLAAQRDDEIVDLLFHRHLRAYPQEAGAASAERIPDADAVDVPALLAAPPWTRQPPARVKVTLDPSITAPTIVWLEGEQERWAYNWQEFLAEEMLTHLPLAKNGTAPPEFYITAPAESVRPYLDRWQAESAWFYLQKPHVVVAKYELDALAPMLRLARKKPVVGAELLVPYRSPEVARLMAQWLTRSIKLRPIAHEWFSRHGSDAAALLLPAALGGAIDESRTAALALHRIDRDDVLEAAERVGCREAVGELLARDPLDLVPAKIPSVPKWAAPEYLPQITLTSSGRALPRDAVGSLLRMVAMSQLDWPYEGIAVVASACDPDTLATFAWTLFRLWEIEGRPSKDAWAMNALGYLGDDLIAERLAPLIRAWPSEGAAPRAKRGVDVLAAMGTDRALSQLSALARNAKSTPLRAHATAALDRVATQRGLLPEQLDDLLAPDLGLDDAPLDYRGVSYTVELSSALALVLTDPAGAVHPTLPKPADDPEKAIASAWNSCRRKAKPIVADQVRRLEEAMTVQREWALDEFRNRVVAHPLLGRLARRVIWALDDNVTAAVDALGDLVDPSGGLVAEPRWVRVAHPAADDFAPWNAWLDTHRASQPFPQGDREVFLDEDPSVYWDRSVPAERFFALARRGWHWGQSGRQARREQLFRPFGASGRVSLTLDPGVSAVRNPANEPPQTILEITFESSAGELGLFTDLPKVTRSELIRSLRSLD